MAENKLDIVKNEWEAIDIKTNPDYVQAKRIENQAADASHEPDGEIRGLGKPSRSNLATNLTRLEQFAFERTELETELKCSVYRDNDLGDTTVKI
jgi:hypothetical protein